MDERSGEKRTPAVPSGLKHTTQCDLIPSTGVLGYFRAPFGLKKFTAESAEAAEILFHFSAISAISAVMNFPASYTLTGCLAFTGTGVSQLKRSGISPRTIP